MTVEQIESALGLRSGSDMPAASRRSMGKLGLIDEEEGGFPAGAFTLQDASLTGAILDGNRGRLVSRWGHILLRRALASRMDAPRDVPPADFAAMRAGLLLRMGEAEAARALVQDVDPGLYSRKLADTAFDAYVVTADFTGLCPVIQGPLGARDDPRWRAQGAICSAFRGDGANAIRQLDRALNREEMDRIDLLLAQKYAGAAGRSRQAVTIEWDGVNAMTPWRYGLTIAVGLEPPERLTRGMGAQYAAVSAQAPMLGLERRAEAADLAGASGILSGAAMVDLYGQIHAAPDISGQWSQRAELLRGAYVRGDAASRLVAMQELWNSASGPVQRYSRQVLTAAAAARLPVDPQLKDSTGDLIASMLAAGYDRNALRWGGVVEPGSQGWALLALADPRRAASADSGALDSYIDDDDSPEGRKSAFLVAGLAGLGRIDAATKASLSSRLSLDLDSETRWTRLIAGAAAKDNQAMVAVLAGLGMQGSGWDKMTPRHLYRIVEALRRVGLEAEARMIAAEAVARG